MKIQTIRNATFGVVLAGSLSIAWGAPAKELALAPTSSLWLVGDSTLHPFTSKTSELQMKSQLAPLTGEVIPALLDKQALQGFDFSLPVTSLKSKEKGLDKNMYKALKAEACPTIEFHMTKYDVATSTRADRPAQASGTLKIACQERPVTLPVSLKPDTGGLHATGQYQLLMSEYGIKPPSMMMGTIKVKDPVVVHYDLQLSAL